MFVGKVSGRRVGRRWTRWILQGSLLLGIGLGSGAFAQVPTSEPFADDAAPSTPELPDPSIPDAADPGVTTSREEQLEARIRQLEATVERLSNHIMNQPPAGGGAGGGAPGGGGPGGGTQAAGVDTGTPATNETPSASGGPSAPGQSLPPNPPPSARFQRPATLDNRRANVKFGPGFEIRSNDEEFILQFHNLTQFEYRGYEQSHQDPERDSFLFPRQWFMFSGRMGKPLGYFLSFANGFDTFSILDVFLDVSYDPRLQLRLGRFKTPFTYEFFVEPIQGLISPERSVFFNNFALNRDLGVMAFGRILDKKVDYAVGFFNGSRNQLIDQNESKSIAAFVNYKPFNNAEGSILENFNVGGSVFGGNQNNLPVPQTLRTIVPTTGNAAVGVPFLSFNSDVRESGDLTFWDLHTAWYYRQVSLIGEWGSGFQDYALVQNLGNRTHLGVQSFYVQGGFFLTGETASGLGVVKPLRPFDLRRGSFGLGAWELTTRYAYMDIGRDVFTNGLADPNLWTNQLSLTDLGVNWHVTQYLRMTFDWQHADFGNPVRYAPGLRQLTSDLFLIRAQLYF